MADELHVMPQHYIRAKVILGGLSLAFMDPGAADGGLLPHLTECLVPARLSGDGDHNFSVVQLVSNTLAVSNGCLFERDDRARNAFRVPAQAASQFQSAVSGWVRR